MRKKGNTRFIANSTYPILSDGRFGSDTRTESLQAVFSNFFALRTSLPPARYFRRLAGKDFKKH